MDNKERLLDTALRLFAQRGVDAVGVQEVVEAAGVTKPTLYHHHGNKEGLVKALLERGFASLNAVLDAVGSYDRDLPWYLERQAGCWVESVRTQPDWFRVQLSLTFLPPENPAAAWVLPGRGALQARMEGLFQEAAGQHGNMRGRHRLLAAGWLSTLYHWTGLSLAGDRAPDPALIHAGTRQFLYGVFS